VPCARPGRRVITLWACVAGVYVLAYGLWLATGWGAVSRAHTISDAAFLPVSLVAALLSWRAAKRQPSRRLHRAWKLIAISYFCYWAGDAGWFYFDAVRGTRPYPSLADAGYLSFYPFLAAGLIYLGSKSRSWREWAVLGMDTATVTLGSFLVIWYLVIAPTITADGAARTAWLTRTLDVAYPMGDVIVLFGMAVVLLSRPTAARDCSLALLTGGLCLFVCADVIYSHMSLTGSYTDRSWVNELWMAGQAMTALSALLAAQPGRSTDPAPAGTVAGRRVSRLPFVGVAGALSLLLVVSAEELSRRFVELIAGVIILTLIVAVRQFTALQDNRRLLNQLRAAAETDHLTGVASRSHFFGVAESLAEAHTGVEPVGLLMIDIDHFKSINDTFGHLLGDEVLRLAAQSIGSCVREHDLVGRVGGDEIAVLLPNCPPEMLIQIADRLTAAVRSTFVQVGHEKVRFTVSIGGTCLSDEGNLAVGMARADQALYRTKRDGRDNWTIDAISGPLTSTGRSTELRGPAKTGISLGAGV
jgi:diguanylate cyclase (GGDEF)-like protein